MPLTPQEQRELDMLELEALEAEAAAATRSPAAQAPAASSRQPDPEKSAAFASATPVDRAKMLVRGFIPQAQESLATGEAGLTDGALSIGAPIAAGVALGPLGAAPMAAIGDAIVQARKINRGEQESYRPGQTAQMAIVNAMPFSNAPGVSGVMKNIMRQGAAGGLGAEIRSLVDNGTAAPIAETAISTAIPAAGAAIAPIIGRLVGMLNRQVSPAEAARVAQERLGNANKDRVLAAMQAKGAAVVPSSVNPSVKNSVLESVAGIQNVEAGVARRNAPIFADAARREAGLAATDPINEATLEAARGRIASTSYAPVRAAGQGQLLDDWREASTLLKKAQKDLDAGFTNARGQAVDDAAANLAAKESELSAAGFGRELQDAKVKFAKNYDVEQVVPSGTDEVNPAILSNLLRQRGEQGLTGELRDIAQFNNAFGRSAKNPTKLATAPGAATAGTALLAGGGNPATTAAMVGGIPVLRGMIRDRLVSPAYQQANAVRNYIPRRSSDPQLGAIVEEILARLSANAAPGVTQPNP